MRGMNELERIFNARFISDKDREQFAEVVRGGSTFDHDYCRHGFSKMVNDFFAAGNSFKSLYQNYDLTRADDAMEKIQKLWMHLWSSLKGDAVRTCEDVEERVFVACITNLLADEPNYGDCIHNLDSQTRHDQSSTTSAIIPACLHTRYDQQCGFMFTRVFRYLETLEDGKMKTDLRRLVELIVNNVDVGRGRFRIKGNTMIMFQLVQFFDSAATRLFTPAGVISFQRLLNAISLDRKLVKDIASLLSKIFEGDSGVSFDQTLIEQLIKAISKSNRRSLFNHVIKKRNKPASKAICSNSFRGRLCKPGKIV